MKLYQVYIEYYNELSDYISRRDEKFFKEKELVEQYVIELQKGERWRLDSDNRLSKRETVTRKCELCGEARKGFISYTIFINEVDVKE